MTDRFELKRRIIRTRPKWRKSWYFGRTCHFSRFGLEKWCVPKKRSFIDQECDVACKVRVKLPRGNSPMRSELRFHLMNKRGY